MQSNPLDILFIQDLILGPIYLVIIIVVALLLRKKYTKGQPHIKKYFMPALYLRLIGAFTSAMMYHFYYGGGDTSGYYFYGEALLYALSHDPAFAWELWTTHPQDYTSEINIFFSMHKVYYIGRSIDTVLVGRIGTIIMLFTFKSYLATSFVLGFFSFLGCWKLFEVFNAEYPHLHKQIALATLFVPSIFFWGSAGLMKDTIIIIAMGYTVWGAYFLFIKNKKRFIYPLYIIIGFYLIFNIKLYVAISLFPALALWVILRKLSGIKNRALKRVAFPVLLSIGGIGVLSILFMLTNISGSKYNVDRLSQTVQDTQGWHKEITDLTGGVSYDLGKWSSTPAGVISMIPKAINVTLFRPYFWEAKKVILLPTVVESFLTLI